MEDESTQLVRMQESIIGKSYSPDIPSKRLRRKQASVWERRIPIFAIVLSFALSCVPAALDWSHTTFSSESSLYKFSTQSRASVQVVVTILSSIFAFFWTWSLGSTCDLLLRSSLTDRALSIDQLRLCSAVSTRSINTYLSLRFLSIPILLSAIYLLPAWLWTGAITPQVVITGLENAYVRIPQFGEGSYPFLGDYDLKGAINQGCVQISKSNGSFSNCPARRQAGSILQSIGTASTAPGVPRNHSKLDNSGYQYLDRSYGVGASVGLQAPPGTAGATISYNYTEMGYLTSAKCIYNASADFNLSENVTFGIPGIPDWFWQQGRRPNDRWDQPPPGAAAHAGFESEPVDIVGWSAGSCCGFTNGTGPFYISMAAGSDYAFLNTTQCELFFEPAIFDVAVSIANRTIHVTQVLPNESFFAPEDPNPAGYLREWTLRALSSLALIETTLYVSSIGENFINNAQTKLNQPDFNASQPNNDAVLPAIEDSLVAALDDILEALAGFAFVNDSSTWSGAVSGEVPRVRVGETQFIIALFVTNVLVLVGVCGMAVHTRGYANTPAFNFMDIGALVVGMDNGRQLANEETAAISPSEPRWDGDPSDPLLDHFAVEIRSKLGVDEAPSVRLQSRIAR
ncbi:hypothetical protein M409DRAFT_23245 [Zasmidium cellare ATCC 36951]|uniref:Uncharacterized protein n=1 Tax=Zasmidium cellare ATCC 36951 TaxID=1080233 RepID=A0A6A6CHU8_ZASCE|nr:uncharacterized protein M409DRAFT_23245 [Zasmidium cellare ATCC 36951]KAF2166611.1 hypothetical protein M409DRAFT_23245 [Zasmidium cellare ATCC 36951]